MRSAFPLLAPALAFAFSATAAPPVDNVLERMVPPGTTSLVGARMDRIKQTEIYKKLAARKLPQVDQFALETGFDPRRDVRELLFATTKQGSVMLARGTFHPNQASLKGAAKTRHAGYEIFGRGTNGFCILDATLAAAGEIPAIEAALDEWKSGPHNAAQPLLARIANMSAQAQFWGVSIGSAGFLAEHPPGVGRGMDLSSIFSRLENTSFQVDLSTGFRADVHGTTVGEKDALSLRDAVKGMVGLGRLRVPENQPEMLRFWDGITVDQQGRSIAIKADIPQDLFDKLLQILNAAPASIL